ncbi:putative mRNA capping enzyme [Megavirus vitis]|uniref:mRNA capping enzyme n=6 Tax=Megamimivirinae TaxID=3044648 RepID=A0A2L2DMQ6_MIMIV|nr:putative mRNA capping enzyme [Megavirus chiliensis]AEQ33345.1 mRNA capping enzyme [Megavirus chiliensis]AUV58543.1 mRNA capping enzyme [Bandra megavirus]AVG47436.1 mRNA capping enzyme [Acanthamoeba polyphaga mimivirus]AVL93922.1 putative mRNA capping enzyme [Megavirus vitis]
MNNSPTPIKNAGLGTREVKNLVLKYLYSSRVNLNLRHEYIKNEKDLDNIRDNDYIVCPRFSGTRSWILFFKSEYDIYYAVNFPKHSQKKKEYINIFPIDVTVSKDFYRGTIMEGIYFTFDDKRYLIVDEVYMLSGQDQMLKPKCDRLDNLTQCFKKSVVGNNRFNLYVSQYYRTDKNNLKEMYEKIKTDPKIQEIIFYPNTYGRKIYSYTIIDLDLQDDITKYSCLIMEKTASSDVFNLYFTNTQNKIGIAYIPDMATSKMCKQWFKDAKTNKLIVKCKLHIAKNKWIPVEVIETDIENVEENESDNSDESND